MKRRSVEIRERALGIIGVRSVHDTDAIRRNFRRQIRLVNPHGPDRFATRVPGFPNTEVARLLIQAYGHLTGRPCPTTMLENDALIGQLLPGRITPIAETATDEDWHVLRFYDQFGHSIWPTPPAAAAESAWKFKGIC